MYQCDLESRLDVHAARGEAGEDAGGRGAEVGAQGERVSSLEADEAGPGQGGQGGGEHRAGLDQDGQQGAQHHGQVASQPAQAPHRDVRVDDILNHVLHLVAQ